MKIDQNYLDLLLRPLKNKGVMTTGDYLNELESLGVELSDNETGYINSKFLLHIEHLLLKKMISDTIGNSTLERIGFEIGSINPHFSYVDHCRIMLKPEEEAQKMTQNVNHYNFGAITTEQMQVGNNNSQYVNINMQQLVEKVAKSNDKEAKSLIKQLLENSTVASVLGASASALIGLL